MKILVTIDRNNCHSLYRYFIDIPPKWVTYYTLDDFLDNPFNFNRSNFIKWLWNRYNLIRKIKKIVKENNIDLIYATDWIPILNSPVPYIMDLEHFTSFFFHDVKHIKLWKFYVKNILLKQKQLKYIIPRTQAGADSITKNIKLSKKMLEKIKTIHLCLDKSEPCKLKQISHENFTILFITSKNAGSEWTFLSKWWGILIKVLEKLWKDGYKIKLIIRGVIPEKYKYILKNPLVEQYWNILPQKDYECLFLKSDIFCFPGYQSPWIAFLDALYFWLPIVTTNIFANKEHVIEWQTWFLVDFPKNSKVFQWEDLYKIKGIPTPEKCNEDKLDETFYNNLYEKIAYIYNHKTFQDKASKLCKQYFLKNFTITKRNNELSKVYNATLK